MEILSQPLLVGIVLFGIVIAVLLVASNVSRYAGSDAGAGHLVSLRFGFLGFVITFVVVRMPPPGSPRDDLLGSPRPRVRIRAGRASHREDDHHHSRGAWRPVLTSAATGAFTR